MLRSALIVLAMAACFGRAHALPNAAGVSINKVAAYYHQGRFDSAMVLLGAMKSEGPWKRRDSLAYFQYSGMASSRLGHDSEAVVHFGGLLGLDSLFQFPRNEDPQVLKDFGRAQETKRNRDAAVRAEAAAIASAAIAVPAAVAVPAALPESAAAPDSATAFSFAASGSLPPRAPAGTGKIGLAYGSLPLGTGWFLRHRVKQGLVLGLLQGGGLALSLYASHRVSREEGDFFAIRDDGEKSSVDRWQLVQRVSLSAALGAYLFSLIASAGD